MIAETATAFVAVVTFFMADGQVLSAEGQSFTTYDACMIQAEADAKTIEREISRIESELSEPGILEVRIVCEPMQEEGLGHYGCLPWEARHESR